MTEPSKRTILFVTMLLIIFSLFGTCSRAGATELNEVIQAQRFHIKTLRGQLSQRGKQEKLIIAELSKMAQDAEMNSKRLYHLCLSVFLCMSVLCIILTGMGYVVGTHRGRRLE